MSSKLGFSDMLFMNRDGNAARKAIVHTHMPGWVLVAPVRPSGSCLAVVAWLIYPNAPVKFAAARQPTMSPIPKNGSFVSVMR